MILKNRNREKAGIKTFIILHAMFCLFSVSTVFSKMAGNIGKINVTSIAFYGGMVAVLGIYAILWQQVIKKIPLTLAYSNKGATVIWGMIWGYLLFHEKISIYNVIGSIIIVAGIVLFATGDSEGEANNV